MMQKFLTRLGRLWRLVVQPALDRAAVAFTPAGTGRTLVIIRADAIGDFVLWLSTAERLIARFGQPRTVLVSNHLVADLARATGLFDEVVGVDINAFKHDRRYRFAMLRRIRRLDAAVAVQPTFSRSFWGGDALLRATAAPERIGQAGDLNNMGAREKRISDRWYTHLVPAVPGPRHELERDADFLRGLGETVDGPASPSLGPLSPGPVGQLPAALQGSPDYVVIVPGAGSGRRMWPVDRFADLARRIADARGLRLVICGSPGERALGEELVRRSGLDGALMLAGQTSLTEMIETMRHARLVVANDSGGAHIAAAVGTPSICLLGGGHFGRFLPYPEALPDPRPICVHADMDCFGCNWRCTRPHDPQSPLPCLEAIPTEAAVTAALHALASRGT